MNPGRDDGRTVAAFGQIKVRIGHRWNVDPKIEAVHQRAGNAAQVILAADRSAGAGARRVGKVAALAGIGGGNQHEPAGIADMGVGPGDDDLAGLDRLAQCFQHGARIFREFVHEQHSVMRQ